MIATAFKTWCGGNLKPGSRATRQHAAEFFFSRVAGGLGRHSWSTVHDILAAKGLIKCKPIGREAACAPACRGAEVDDALD